MYFTEIDFANYIDSVKSVLQLSFSAIVIEILEKCI